MLLNIFLIYIGKFIIFIKYYIVIYIYKIILYLLISSFLIDETAFVFKKLN